MKSIFQKIEIGLLNNSPYILFVSIFLMFSFLAPKFLEFQNIENIIKHASFIGIVAVGMTFVLLTAGIDLSVGSNMYLSGAVAGLLIENFGVSSEVALLFCLFVGFLFGAVNSFLITKLKIIPFIATLGTMVAGRGIALLLTKSKAVTFPDEIVQIGSIKVLGIVPLPIVIFGIVVLVASIFLNRTKTGRQIYAVGNNLNAAKRGGINSDKILSTSYITCGVLAALGGFISVAQLGIINSGFGSGYEFDAIAAAVLGGTSLFGGIGTVFPGTVSGAVLMQMISTGLVFTQTNIYLQPILTGAIIFLAVFLDSIRNIRITKMQRRNIRVEKERE